MIVGELSSLVLQRKDEDDFIDDSTSEATPDSSDGESSGILVRDSDDSNHSWRPHKYVSYLSPSYICDIYCPYSITLISHIIVYKYRLVNIFVIYICSILL